MLTAYSRATIQPKGLPSSSVTYSTRAGATPNATASDNESSSAPILVVASSRRAMRPSRESSTAAAPIMPSAVPNWPSRANFTADRPAESARIVMTLGSSRTACGRPRRLRSGAAWDAADRLTGAER